MSALVRCANPKCTSQVVSASGSRGPAVYCPRCRSGVAAPASAPPAAETYRSGAGGQPARATVGGGAIGQKKSAAERIGRYEVRDKLGEGAFGAVYRAVDPSLGREVALKVQHPGAASNPELVERFLREAKTGGSLHHPHIVPVYEVGRDGDRHYIAAALVKGKSLSDTIPEGGTKVRRAARLVRELAEALAHAHAQNIIHRDVKPANILVDDAEDRVHLTDFGLAKAVDGTKLTKDAGALIGTPAYMAPEQAAQKNDTVGPLADQYACGVVLYELLTGKPPFDGMPLPIVIYNVVNTDPPPPSESRANVPPELDTICRKAMSKNPKDRYPDCQALATDLRRFLDREDIEAREQSSLKQTVRWAARKPMAAAAFALTVTTVVLLAVVGVFAVLREQTIARLNAAEAAAASETQGRQGADAARAGLEDDLRREQKARQDADASHKSEAAAHKTTLADLARATTDHKAAAAALQAATAERDRVAKQLGAATAARDDAAARAETAAWDHYATAVQAAHREARQQNFTVAARLLAECDPARRGWEWHFVSRLAKPKAAAVGDHKAEVTALAVRGDGRRVASGGADGMVHVWDAGAKNQSVFSFSAHDKSRVNAVAFSPTGDTLVTAGGDGKVVLWDAARRQSIRQLGRYKNEAFVAAFSRDGDQILTAGWDQGDAVSEQSGRVRLYQAGGKELQQVPAAAISVYAAGFSPAGDRILTAGDRGVVWDADLKGQKATFKGFKGPAFGVSFRGDGSAAATAGPDGRVRVWDAASGELALAFAAHKDRVNTAAFSPDGARIVTSDKDGAVRVWDARTGDELATLAAGGRDAAKVAQFTPNGTAVVTATVGGAVQVWAAADESVPIPTAAGGSPSSPDGSRSVGVAADGTVRVKDAKSGRVLLTLAGYGSGIESASFDAGGRLLTVSREGTSRAWDVARP